MQAQAREIINAVLDEAERHELWYSRLVPHKAVLMHPHWGLNNLLVEVAGGIVTVEDWDETVMLCHEHEGPTVAVRELFRMLNTWMQTPLQQRAAVTEERLMNQALWREYTQWGEQVAEWLRANEFTDIRHVSNPGEQVLVQGYDHTGPLTCTYLAVDEYPKIQLRLEDGTAITFPARSQWESDLSARLDLWSLTTPRERRIQRERESESAQRRAIQREFARLMSKRGYSVLEERGVLIVRPKEGLGKRARYECLLSGPKAWVEDRTQRGPNKQVVDLGFWTPTSSPEVMAEQVAQVLAG